MDIQNIIQTMISVYTKSKEDDYVAKIIKSIPSGGDSSFTNKVGKGGKIKDFNFPHNTPLHLFARTLALSKFTQAITQNKINPDFHCPIKVYRAMNLPNSKRVIVQPVPFSTTWNLKFAMSWMEKSGCCIYEITVAFDTFLPLSVPSGSTSKFKRFALNQSQEEVILPPCKLTKKGEYIITMGKKSVRVITCIATRLLPTEIVDCYPEKYKTELLKVVHSKGWMNEKLLQYYDCEVGEGCEGGDDEPEWA